MVPWRTRSAGAGPRRSVCRAGAAARDARRGAAAVRPGRPVRHAHVRGHGAGGVSNQHLHDRADPLPGGSDRRPRALSMVERHRRDGAVCRRVADGGDGAAHLGHFRGRGARRRPRPLARRARGLDGAACRILLYPFRHVRRRQPRARGAQLGLRIRRPRSRGSDRAVRRQSDSVLPLQHRDVGDVGPAVRADGRRVSRDFSHRARRRRRADDHESGGDGLRDCGSRRVRLAPAQRSGWRAGSSGTIGSSRCSS